MTDKQDNERHRPRLTEMQALEREMLVAIKQDYLYWMRTLYYMLVQEQARAFVEERNALIAVVSREYLSAMRTLQEMGEAPLATITPSAKPYEPLVPQADYPDVDRMLRSVFPEGMKE